MKIIKLLPLYLFFLTPISQAQLPQNITPQNPRQILLPWNRLIQPAGLQVYFGDKDMENHSLDAALSPDGKFLAVMERYSIVFISTTNNQVKFTLPNDNYPDLKR